MKLGNVLKRGLAMILVVVVAMGLVPVQTIVANAKENLDKDQYLLQVNKSTCVVTVFQKNAKGKYKDPVKAFVCSPGNDTPVGTFQTPNRFRWQPLMGDVWGQYCTQVTGNILFHSVYYNSRDAGDLSVAAYNNLGLRVSHGCIRLTVADAKWIYENCALGTTVKVINGSSKKDPLGKPKAIKINNGLRWDPTDPDPKNPWKKRLFKIDFTGESKEITYGAKVPNLKNLVSLTDVTGRKASKKKYLKVSGKIDTNKIGKYVITYSATDKDNVTTTKKVTFKVVDGEKPIIKGAKDATIERNSEFNPKKGVSAKMASGKKLTSKIKISGKVNTSNVGTYVLTYSVKGTNKLTAKVKRKITVVDTTNPEVSSVEDKTIKVPAGSVETQIKAAIVTDVEDKISVVDNGKIVPEPNVVVNITKDEVAEDTYHVSVVVEDVVGNKTEVTVTYKMEFVEVTDATTDTTTDATTESRPQ